MNRWNGHWLKLTITSHHCCQATEPIDNDTIFQIWSRISLRTALEAYPVFDKRSLRQMMSHTAGLDKKA
jgi:hypothetical protein